MKARAAFLMGASLGGLVILVSCVTPDYEGGGRNTSFTLPPDDAATPMEAASDDQDSGEPLDSGIADVGAEEEAAVIGMDAAMDTGIVVIVDAGSDR